MSTTSRKLILGLCALLLAGAALYQFLGPHARRGRMVVPDFDAVLRKDLPGWVAQDKPVAESPEMLKIVETLLRYDYALFRTYRRGDAEISVYLAYWLPGKVDPRNVDAHTPDVCWVANGWKMQVLPELPPRQIDGHVIPLVNHRGFTINGVETEVLYWHINGGEFRQSVSVDEMKLPKLEAWKRRAAKEWTTITAGVGAQLFIRVSTNGVIANRLDTEPLQAVMQVLAEAMQQGAGSKGQGVTAELQNDGAIAAVSGRQTKAGAE